MQNEIQVFTNEKFGCVQMAVTDGKLRFAGMDVAVVPEYSNPPRPVRNQIDDANRMVNDLFTVHGTPGMQTNIPQRLDTLYAKPKEVL